MSWLNWDLSEENQQLLEFVRRITALRRSQPVLRRSTFCRGKPLHEGGAKDACWFSPLGKEMTHACWHDPQQRCLGMQLSGEAIGELDEDGKRLAGDTLLVLANATHEAVSFTFPSLPLKQSWESVVDTAKDWPEEPQRFRKKAVYPLEAFSLAVFKLHKDEKA